MWYFLAVLAAFFCSIISTWPRTRRKIQKNSGFLANLGTRGDFQSELAAVLGGFMVWFFFCCFLAVRGLFFGVFGIGGHFWMDFAGSVAGICWILFFFLLSEEAQRKIQLNSWGKDTNQAGYRPRLSRNFLTWLKSGSKSLQIWSFVGSWFGVYFGGKGKWSENTLSGTKS